PRLVKALIESRHQVGKFVARSAVEKAHDRRPLLRTRATRLGRRCAGHERDELAPPHLHFHARRALKSYVAFAKFEVPPPRSFFVYHAGASADTPLCGCTRGSINQR